MAKKNFLQDNPLFSTDTEQQPTQEEKKSEEPKRRGRPRNNELLRDNSTQDGLTQDYTRATFILKVETLNALKDYAYTNRITIKDAVEEIISAFFDNYDGELLDHSKK